MGLRVEQHNIEDLLKYFVARNELGRKNIVAILEGLTDDERAKMNITNYAEFYSFYKFLYKLLKEDLVEGIVTTTKNSKDLIGRSCYDREFLERYPFEYILSKRLKADITKEYKFIYRDYTNDSTINYTWNYILDNDIEIVSLTSEDVMQCKLEDFGITLYGTPDVGDIISFNYRPYNSEAEEKADVLVSVIKGTNIVARYTDIDVDVFDRKVRLLSDYNFDEDTSNERLFDKIIDSNPELPDSILGVHNFPLLIDKSFDIVYNSEFDNKYKLNDLFTLDENIYYTHDDLNESYKGFTELTKKTLILAELRKILDSRMVRYTENQYLTDVVYDQYNDIQSFDLDIEPLMALVLNTNPFTTDEVYDGDTITFRTLQSEINNLKSYVNDYILNENVNIDNKYFMKKGKANYAGYGNCTIIPHNTGLYPVTTIVNLVNPVDNKDIGDVYVRSDKENIYVYNSGKNTSEFEFTSIFDSGDFVEFPIDKTFDDFIKISINGIKKVKFEKDNISINENGCLVINMDDGLGGSLYNKFDFVIITDSDKIDRYYQAGDEELFVYDADANTLTAVSSETVKYNEGNSVYITAMNIDDAPILWLLNNLMNNPNYYIQNIANFSDLIFTPTEDDFNAYSEVLGESAVADLKNKTGVQYIDITGYDIDADDVIFINNLAYSIVDSDYFTKINYVTITEEEIRKEHKVLAIFDLNIDDIDVIHFSRLTSDVNPFDMTDDDDTEVYESYMFGKYVYLNSHSAFGRQQFKKDSILEEGHELDPEGRYPLDPSTRLYNRDPLTNRIEYYMTYGEYQALQAQRYDANDSVKISKQTRVTVVSHKLGKTPNFVVINPIATSNVYNNDKVGNIYWNADEDNLYVYNTGDSTCEFDWFVTYDENIVTVERPYKSALIINKDDCLFYNLSHKTGFNELGYTGNDYITYNKKSEELTIFNTNVNNHSYTSNFSYIANPRNVKNTRFLQYADSYSSDQDGYFDRDTNSKPTGTKVLNYSGEFRATTARFYGDAVVQFLPVEEETTFETGDIVSYVNGVCKLADFNYSDTVIGVVADNYALAIDSYDKAQKIPVAFYGVQTVKVIGFITPGDTLYIDNENTEAGVATLGGTRPIGRALEKYNNIDEVGKIKVILSI